MKITTPIALFGALTLAASGAGAEPLNLLFYGNSFSASGGGVHTLVRDIATAAGHETPHVYGRIVSGQTLEYHLNTGTSVITSGIPAGQEWDFVTLQEYSTRPTTHPADGNVPAFLNGAQGLYQAVQNHSPDARAVLFETWARHPAHFFYPDTWSGPEVMQQELRDNYNAAQALLDPMGGAEVAPVGDAFQGAGFETPLYAGDLYHASNKGALLISLVLYGTIYDDTTTGDFDLSGVRDRLGLSQQDVDDVTAFADAVLVPAPGSAALLVGFGALAARRRR
ncbi:MAG: hypothetical protein ACF8Q5_12295 [Phycisphaerales bacterium JB040]